MKRSICLVLVTVVFVQAAPSVNPYADDMKEREKMGMSCLKEVNIDRQTIDRAVATLNFPIDDQKYKEFLACSYKKQGYQTDDGVIQYNHIKDFLSRFYNRSDLKIIDNCKSDVKKSHGDRAFDALVCVMENLKVIEETSPRSATKQVNLDVENSL